MKFRIISIGTLAAHPLWGEKVPIRTGHGTTTLVSSGDRFIIVDPSLPAQVLQARLHERCGLTPQRITHVFLTSFHRDLRRGLPLFEHATWWVAEAEREAVGVALLQQFEQAREVEDDDAAELLRREIELVRRCQAAPDQLAAQVDLFPLPGRTPGCAGLLLSLPGQTVLICGDAIPTVEHLEQAKVLPDCYDIKQARESFAEAVGIADWLIPGRDNLLPNPTRGPF